MSEDLNEIDFANMDEKSLDLVLEQVRMMAHDTDLLEKNILSDGMVSQQEQNMLDRNEDKLTTSLTKLRHLLSSLPEKHPARAKIEEALIRLANEKEDAKSFNKTHNPTGNVDKTISKEDQKNKNWAKNAAETLLQMGVEKKKEKESSLKDVDKILSNYSKKQNKEKAAVREVNKIKRLRGDDEKQRT